ncbi:MAG: Fic family protein [Clostridiales bacterium]|nr:Fic family protein [Clostridiales bacterium]
MENLLSVLKRERESRLPGGIYHKLQIEFSYNSNHIEGSQLTHEQTRYIFETNTIGLTDSAVNVDDIVETANHFRCLDMVIDDADRKLDEKFILKLHEILKSGTSDSRNDWVAGGAYKKLPNEVGGRETTPPEEVGAAMRSLLEKYNAIPGKSFEDILDFHVRFERIHPFQDGNGRVGRLILFKECLKNGVIPFVITDDMKLYYYRGLSEWDNEKGYLTDTCLSAQDQFREWMASFRIK